MDENFDFMLCSSLRRTKETARQISKQIGLNNIVYTDKLRELNTPKFLYGELQDGVRANEFNDIIRDKMNLINDPIEKYNLEFTKERFNLQRNILDELNYKLAETYKKYSTRIEDIINFIKNIDYKKIIIVSHGCLIEDLLKKIFNVCMIPKIDVENCFICYCTLKNDIFTMISPCNSKHLSLENLSLENL
jgi:broad specificity phosphatase PhoE